MIHYQLYKYTTIFNDLHEDEIELALFTNNIISVFLNLYNMSSQLFKKTVPLNILLNFLKNNLHS